MSDSPYTTKLNALMAINLLNQTTDDAGAKVSEGKTDWGIGELMRGFLLTLSKTVPHNPLST